MTNKEWALKTAHAVLKKDGWDETSATKFVAAVADVSEVEAREALALAHAALEFAGALGDKARTGTEG